MKNLYLKKKHNIAKGIMEQRNKLTRENRKIEYNPRKRSEANNMGKGI